MIIRVDARELQDVLRLTPRDQNILLAGRHGIGKSEIISAFYRSQGMPVVPFFLGQMSDPGDLIGLMHKDEDSGRSVFLPPFWWPSAQQPVVLFLDELNRARPELLQSIHDLALNKTLSGKRLPAGSVIVAAVNKGEEYQLTDLDPALVSRFNLYEFAPTVDDWLLWASDQRVDPRVIAFIQQHPELLDGAPLTPEESWRATGLVKHPDRRAWVRVSQFVSSVDTLEEIHVKIIAGMIGTSAALAFRQSLARTVRLTPQQVLRELERHRKTLGKLSLQELVLLNEGIMLWLHGRNYGPHEEDTMRQNVLAYLKALKGLKQHEALAHLASLMENPKFERATELLTGSLEIVTFLTGYIDGIQI